jgi:hypothetical protein
MRMRVLSFLVVLALSFGGIFLTQPANSAEPIPTPDLTDIYYPILKGLKVEVDVAATADANKRITFPTVAKVELTIRYHRNSTYALEIVFAKTQGDTSPGCYSSPYLYLQAPKSSFEIQKSDSRFSSNKYEVKDKVGNRKILEKLVKREKVGDWFEESFEFTTPIFENEFIEPCVAAYRADYIRIFDVAGKEKAINHFGPEMLSRGFSDYFRLYDSVSRSTRVSDALPEARCPIIGTKEFINVNQPGPSLCEDTANLDLASFSITREMIDASVAKALNPPKVVVSPTIKKTTITCIKGKLTKKVTAVNPKCPSGYKKK